MKWDATPFEFCPVHGTKIDIVQMKGTEYRGCNQCKDWDNKAPRGVVNCIVPVTTGGIVLIDRKNRPLGYSLPGGSLDFGEDPDVAGAREVFEETGLVVKIQKIILAKTYKPANLLVLFYSAQPVSELPKAGDDAAAAFVVPTDAIPFDKMAPGHELHNEAIRIWLAEQN